MQQPLRNLFRDFFAAAALTLMLVPAAQAGGTFARLEGPAKDGHTYTVRATHCGQPAALRVSGWAEGRINGKRQTLPLVLSATSEQGVYRFQRSWPAQGRWFVRLTLGAGRHPATMVWLDADGSVLENTPIWDGDGSKQCEHILAPDTGC